MSARIWIFLLRIPAYVSLCGCLAGFTYWAQAEARQGRDTESQVQVEAKSRAPQDQATLTARLINERTNALLRAATVEVQVEGIRIVDPALTTRKGKNVAKDEAHLHYQVDNGIVIATTAPKLSFHDLAPGEHQITVVLADNNHEPLGPQATLMVTIPHVKNPHAPGDQNGKKKSSY